MTPRRHATSASVRRMRRTVFLVQSAATLLAVALAVVLVLAIGGTAEAPGRWGW